MFEDAGRHLVRIRKVIVDGGTRPLMTELAMMGEASAMKAFETQTFDGTRWLPRYPEQKPPKFNVAGALQDWASGRKAPKPSRFTDRPALVDEGMRGGLWGSIRGRVIDAQTAEWGTTKEYANVHQFGGVSVQPITEDTKERIRKWLYTPSGGLSSRPSTPGSKGRFKSIGPYSVRRDGRTVSTHGTHKEAKAASRKGDKVMAFEYQQTSGPRAAGRPRNEFAEYIVPLLNKKQHRQMVHQRQFIGVPPQLGDDFRRATEAFFKRIAQKEG